MRVWVNPEHMLAFPARGFGKWAFLPRLAVGSLAVRVGPWVSMGKVVVLV